MAEKDELIIVHVRLPGGFEYVGRVKEEEFELDKPFIEMCQPTSVVITEKQGNVNMRCTDLAQITFWEKGPIYIPRNMSIILRVRIAGPLWNAYRNAIGEKVQVHESMPPGVPPPPGSVH